MTDVFLDTANLEEIKEIKSWGIIKGVTTNQKIFLKEKGCNFEKRAKEILDEVYPFPVSLEGPNDYDGIMEAAKEYHLWEDNVGHFFSNIVIKVPMLGNGDGIRAVTDLYGKGIKTNVTACMTLNQVFLAASAGATFVSLFYNRMVDWYNSENEGEKGKQYALETIAHSMKLLELGDFDTELIIGSIRKQEDVQDILTVNPDIITIPTKILKEMSYNSMTEGTLKQFEEAWKEFKKHESK